MRDGNGEQLTAFGRNGMSQVHGIEATGSDGKASISPINSKGEITRCRIDVNLDLATDLICQLYDVFPGIECELGRQNSRMRHELKKVRHGCHDAWCGKCDE